MSEWPSVAWSVPVWAFLVINLIVSVIRQEQARRAMPDGFSTAVYAILWQGPLPAGALREALEERGFSTRFVQLYDLMARLEARGLVRSQDRWVHTNQRQFKVRFYWLADSPWS